jgi:hypothetical protein
MAATEKSITAAMMTLGFYGIFPLALFLWLMGTPQRRRSQKARESASVGERADAGDQADPKRDQ